MDEVDQPMPRQRAWTDALAAVAEDLAGEFRLQPLLERILRSAVDLLGCRSGSLCLIDTAAHTYLKQIDLEEGCQTGQVFPLDEGVTGAVAKAGKPVIFDTYSQVGRGHIAPHEPRYRRAVIGAPILRRGSPIGALVVFAATDEQRFTRADADLLARFATHAAIAMANSRLHEEASARMKADAVVAERERSMLELHDSVGRGLATIMLKLGEAHQQLSRGGDAVAPLLAAQRVAEETRNEGRRAVWGLRPAGHGRRSLAESLQLDLEWLQATSGLAPVFRQFGEPQDVATEVEHQLLRIVGEALANVTQHARASMVRLGLVYGSDGIAVIVEDDGAGFDVDAEMGRPRGVGLRGLVARAGQVGGRVRIDSTPGWGTRVRADLPYRGTSAEAGPRLRVLIVHSQPAMRAGLVRLLAQSEPSVQVVAEVGDLDQAVEALRLLRPAVVLAGTRLPGVTGPALLNAVAAVDPTVGVVAISDRPAAAEAEVREWVAAGARGFVNADADATALGRAVVGVARDDVLVLGGVLEQLGGLPSVEADSRLTTREAEVRALLEQGMADKQIAHRLGISVKTVEKHVSAILRKANVRSRTELLVRA
ncbi:MAG: GAF domain-containing protein [Actinobacteria bacterium]|nr:GAF domain-containing protein [Actinomycetota bacterium]